MGKRQHVKSKNPRAIKILELRNRTASRAPMPRPAKFRDRTKYDRKNIRRPDPDLD